MNDCGPAHENLRRFSRGTTGRLGRQASDPASSEMIRQSFKDWFAGVFPRR